MLKYGGVGNKMGGGEDRSHLCILVKWSFVIKCYRGEKFLIVQYDPLQLSTQVLSKVPNKKGPNK